MKNNKVFMRSSKTALKCNNCDPTYELDKMNPRWANVGKMVEYCKGFVGIQIYEKAPLDYNEKIAMLICPFCNNKLTDTGLPVDDFFLIDEATDSNRQILDEMIELHNKDILEYQLKLNQFRLQKEEADRIFRKRLEDARPHCPNCHSKNIKSISALNRGASIAMWGIFSKKINKSFECKSCGYTW